MLFCIVTFNLWLHFNKLLTYYLLTYLLKIAYSSVVKWCRKGPRDRFNSKIPRAQFFFFIISYFGFIFTSAYNSIVFCYLRRNVEPCCHAHDSRSCIVRDSAWSVSHCRLSRVAVALGVGQYPKPTTVRAVIGRKARHSLRIEILAYPTCIGRFR